MSQILRQYIDDDGLQVTEYTRDGVTVSTIIRHPVPVEIIEPEQPVPVETIDNKFARLEQLIQTDNLTTFEVLATMYEEIGTNTMTQFDVMATMYEEILTLREEVAELKGGTST